MSSLETYGLSVCFVSAIALAIALGILLYTLVQLFSPLFTMDKWEYQRHSGNNAVFLGSSVIGGDGTLYLTSTWGIGTLHAINSTNGTLKWEFDLSAFSYCTPMVAGDGTVYIGDENGTFFAVR